MLVTNFMVIAIQFVNILQINGNITTFPRLIKHEGDTAVLRCFSTLPFPENPIQWKHWAIGSKIQDFSNVYFLNSLSEAYAKDGRYRILNDSLESLDLEITRLSPMEAGTYRCAYEAGSEEYSDIELTVIESPRCTPNISLNNVLIDNECGLSPDFVGLTCSLKYRGNFAPVLQWHKSSKPEDVISTSQFQPQSDVFTSFSLSVKPEFHLNGIYYICSVKEVDMNTQKSVCRTEDIKVAYIFKPVAVLYSGRNDIVTITCIANTSSQECGYRWHGHNLSSNIDFDRIFEKLQLDENMSDVRCVAECKIRSRWCSVTSDIYSNIQYRLKELKSSDQQSRSERSGGESTAIIVCSVILGVLLVAMLVSVCILKRDIKVKIERMMEYFDPNKTACRCQMEGADDKPMPNAEIKKDLLLPKKQELRKKLKLYRPRLVNELDITTRFLESLQSVLSNEDMDRIQSENMKYKRSDVLIDILEKKPDEDLIKFSDLLKVENADLYDLLTGLSEPKLRHKRMEHWCNLTLVYIAYWITLIIHFGNFHLIGAEIKTFPKELIKLEGDSAILHCISSSNPPNLLQWRYLKFDGSAQETENVIFDGKCMELFDKGRQRVTLKESPQTCDLNITGITIDDAGTYICANVNSTEQSEIELIVLESQPRCGTNISLNNVLVENDCSLTPDYVDLTCSVGYRGKIAPVLHWFHSGKPEIVIASSIFQPQSSRITRLNHPIKPTYDMNGTYFICSFETAELRIRARECATNTIVTDYIFRPFVSKTSSSADSVICIANTSSQQCGYRWNGAAMPLKSNEKLFLQLDKTINNLSCTTECEIHGQKCVVTSQVFTLVFPEITIYKPSSVLIISVIVSILGIFIVVLLIFIIYRKMKLTTPYIGFEFCTTERMEQESTFDETDFLLHQGISQNWREKLNNNRDRFVSELELSSRFLIELMAKDVITEEHMALIQANRTTHEKSDQLFEILQRRSYSHFETFCDILRSHNSDLAQCFMDYSNIEMIPISVNYENIDLKNCNPSDIIQGFKKVKSKGKELEDYIDPENGLLTALGNRGIITDSEIDDLQKIVPYQELNGKLLRRIANNIDSISKQFVEALCENEQDHIAKFIVTAGCETDSDERLLPRELRKVIDDNMFCLRNLIDTEKRDLLHTLVSANCITSRHRDRVICSKQEDRAFELLIILQRRRYKDFLNFMKCLRKSMQNNITKILEMGGVSEIKVQLLQERSDEKDIKAELIRKLTGYNDEDKASDLSEEQKKTINELLAELAKNDIYFIGTTTSTSKTSLSMFLQGGRDDLFPVLNDGCESGSLKIKLEEMFRSLLMIPDSSLPLGKEVTTGKLSKRHYMTTKTEQNSGYRSNLAKLQNDIRSWKIHKELRTKCYQLKLHRTEGDDLAEFIRGFHGSEIVLDKIKLTEKQWRTLDLWEILQSVNPRRLMKFDRGELFEPDSTSLENKEDSITLRRSIVLCRIFEDQMLSFGWKKGDTLDIEEDICEVVGKLLMEVEKQDRSSLLDCMQSAMMNIKKKTSKQDGDKLKMLLFIEKKYNGLNLACILLEQMILDNKDNNVSWMRIVCAQFIDLIVQLIIEPDYRENVHWTLTYLLKSESKWKVLDVYNLMKNGLLIFHDNQKTFHRYLMIIRNFALHPSMNISPIKKLKYIELIDILYSHDENKWRCLNELVRENESEKSVIQVLHELKEDEIGQAEKDTIQQIIAKSQTMLNKYNDVREYPGVIERELDRIRKSEHKYGVDVLSSCLAVTSMALYICKGFWPLNTQLVSYCLLVTQRMNEKNRLLEILTREGKSCVIAMVATTYALQEKTVDIVTSSPVLSQRDADEWWKFYSMMDLEVGCNVENNTKEDTACYKCPIVYGTVETFARDILKTEFLLQNVRKGRKCDMVIVGEVDSMLIDQGVQCTYLSHDVPSVGLCHFDPVLALIWMHVNSLMPVINNEGIVFHATEPEVFLVTLSRLRNKIDPLQILRLAEEDEEVLCIEIGFTDKFLSENVEGQEKILRSVDSFEILVFARKILHLDFDIYTNIEDFIHDSIQRNDRSLISIIYMDGGLASVVLHEDTIKDRLTKLITECVSSDDGETKIDLPIYLKDYCVSRLQSWIDNAFLAKELQPGREYIVDGDAIYPVDFKSTGVVETNKKWGDGLQQFLEMKHGLPRSPLSLITNFLSNIDFLERYGSNIVGVTGTLGDDHEKQFMRDTFSVEFATIPAYKRRKLFELDGIILEDEKAWLIIISEKVKSVVASQRAVLVICEDIATANEIHELISSKIETKPYLLTKGGGYDGGHENKKLKPGDVVITTNLGARGTDFSTDDVVNKNGGLFVLVTFIPLNDRVEKQAFGRTGRRGATGSCQIIVNRKAMPEWARLCETVDEVKRLRDSIEMHRLDKNNTTEVAWIRGKQKLFREYCEFKNEFVTSNANEPNDLKIQTEILDETWAKWIQQHETMGHESNHGEMVQELCRVIEACSKQAIRFESDNIYHIMKFGAARLMDGDFEGATKFYDRVIHMDPDWSAFALYNRAYCTIQMKSDRYIKHAIDELRDALCRLEKYKTNCLISEIIGKTNVGDEMNWASKVREGSKSRSYHIMIECQFLHHIHAQIMENIENLTKIDTKNREVTTTILDSIPGDDLRTEKMLQEYRQLGFLFTYNIDVQPQFCYKNQIVSSLVMLESVADIISMAFLKRILMNVRTMKFKYALNALCSLKATGDESLKWMSQCVLRAINIGINSIDSMRDLSSLIQINQTEQKSSYKITRETAQFTQFANSQAKYISKRLDSVMQEMKKLVGSQGDEILLHVTNATMEAFREEIQQTIHEKIKPGQKLHRQLSSVYDIMTPPSRFDLEQFVDCIHDLAKFSASPSQQLSDADFQTDELQNIALKLMSMSRNDSITATDLESFTPEITAAASKIEIGSVITKFSDFLSDMMNVFSQKTTTDGYVRDDVEMLKATNRVLTSAWSEIIRGMLQYRIIRSVMFYIQERAELFVHIRMTLIESMKNELTVESNLYKYIQSPRRDTKQYKPSPDLSNRLKDYNNQIKKSRGPHVPSKIDARMISKHYKRNIIIWDVGHKEEILSISSPDIRESIELIYNPPCRVHPGGHFDAYVKGKVVEIPSGDFDDYDLLFSAISVDLFDIHILAEQIKLGVDEYIDRYPSVAGMLLACEFYACQLKRGRVLLRLDGIPPTIQMSQCEYVELDSSPLSTCIKQALKSENVKSKSRSAEAISPKHGTEMMTLSVSCDASDFFQFSGISVEAKVYRQLVVKKINDGDITTALQLCCIGHQIPFCRDKINSNLSIKDAQSLRDIFEQMLKMESFKKERSKFLSISDEWYEKVLEPQRLMNSDQRELLTKWISNREYANTEDPVVSLVLTNCPMTKLKGVETLGDEELRRGASMGEAKK